MAWRNLWRNRRRSLVTIAAMTLAFASMVVYNGLLEGYMSNMERNIIEIEVGHIQVHAEGYRKRPSLYDKIEMPGEILAQLDEAGLVASARLLGPGLAAAEESSAGVILRGLNPARDAHVSRIGEHVASGEWLAHDDPKGVVLGQRLAHTLGVEAGTELVVLSQAADGSMANDLFHVRGVLKPITEGTDRTGVFMLDRDFRELMVFPEGAHQLIVRTPHLEELEAATEKVAAVAQPNEVKSWRQLFPTLANMLDTQRGAMAFMFMIVYFAIGIVILNAALMAVYERIREFGVLKAVGMSPLSVFRLILMETVYIVIISLVIGLLVAAPFLYLLATSGIDIGTMAGISIMGVSWDTVWRAEINERTFMGPTITLVIIVFVAVLYPAAKAARLNPIDAIRHQ
jgi:ABC-type lipoprotein release transport system permease subunit